MNGRTALLIDGANVSNQLRNLSRALDWKAVLNAYRSSSRLVRAYYFSAFLADAAPDPVRKLLDWLEFNGFTVISKPTKTFTDAAGIKTIKGNMDVEIAVCAMEMARHVEEIVLFSGDGDFRFLVQSIQRAGVRVTVVSTLTQCAEELRRQADDFINLATTDLPIFKAPLHVVMEAAARLLLLAAGGSGFGFDAPRAAEHVDLLGMLGR